VKNNDKTWQYILAVCCINENCQVETDTCKAL